MPGDQGALGGDCSHSDGAGYKDMNDFEIGYASQDYSDSDLRPNSQTLV